MSLRGPFNIMAKPVGGRCNLRCRYCYYVGKPAELYPHERDMLMSPQMLEDFTRQYLQAMPEQCDFSWQGGEPLLAGREFFARAVEFQRQFRQGGQRVSNNLQTNATLMDDAWCEFLAANDFLVGVSLDGPPQVHDAFRRDGAGAATFHLAWRGLELLRKHGVKFNVLVTLNRVTAGRAGDIYRYLRNRGVQYLQFVPVLERAADGRWEEFSCTSEQFGRALVEIFQAWRAGDVGKVSERFIDNVLHTLLYGRAAMCCHAARCAAAYVLEFNGDLYACDHFVQAPWRIGNLGERPLADLVADPKVEQFARLKTDPPSACRGCEYVSLCQGGCPKHHVPIGTDAARTNYFCEAYRAFFREALPDLQRLAAEAR
jgi:uncharacterized protein